MSGNERVKGIQIHRPIIYGSHARLLTDEERALAPPTHTHRWTVFLASAATPPPAPRAANSTDAPPIDKDYRPGGGDDLSGCIKRVVFRLHDTYPNPNRMCEKPPYAVTETGWGEFTVQIKVTFVPEAAEKALTIQHPIKLHHWGEPIEPAPPEPVVEAVVKAEVEAEATPAGDDTPAADSATPATTGAAGTPATPATPADATGTPATPAPVPAAVAHALSIAQQYPVHAWQYDEIVFSDPPAHLLAALEESPPTPLPARNRRPRDQREEHEQRSGKKTKKRPTGTGTSTAVTPAPSAPPSAARSRAGTAASRAGTPQTPRTPAFTGAAGELGSADVPLEFTGEMEKAEFNRLTLMRVKIVDEMDRWRERLIAQEKELARLKEELRG